MVAPGFIDILSTIRPERKAHEDKAGDGVTTAIGILGGPMDIDGYVARQEAARPVVNYGGADYACLYVAETQENLTEERFFELRAQPGALSVQCEFILEGEIVMGIRSPLGVITSDGGGLVDGTGHPRSVGTFARFLGRYVRERATYANPDQRSAGIAYVIVNGQLAMDHGVAVEGEAHPGVPHSGHPSGPNPTGDTRKRRPVLPG